MGGRNMKKNDASLHHTWRLLQLLSNCPDDPALASPGLEMVHSSIKTWNPARNPQSFLKNK
jgi:hypothetical protein